MKQVQKNTQNGVPDTKGQRHNCEKLFIERFGLVKGDTISVNDIKDGWKLILPKMGTDDMIVVKLSKGTQIEFKNQVHHRYFIDEFTGRTILLCWRDDRKVETFTGLGETCVLPYYAGWFVCAKEFESEIAPRLSDGTISVNELRKLQDDEQIVFWADGNGHAEESRFIINIYPTSRGDMIESEIKRLKDDKQPTIDNDDTVALD